mmetsp:Transcript_24634/g.62575  ORF Transcript_24634/g.62575 Transcript_24634/m.62575 type:complete len:106 (-) Transcript_24634:324-641(-)
MDTWSAGQVASPSSERVPDACLSSNTSGGEANAQHSRACPAVLTSTLGSQQAVAAGAALAASPQHRQDVSLCRNPAWTRPYCGMVHRLYLKPHTGAQQTLRLCRA